MKLMPIDVIVILVLKVNMLDDLRSGHSVINILAYWLRTGLVV